MSDENKSGKIYGIKEKLEFSQQIKEGKLGGKKDMSKPSEPLKDVPFTGKDLLGIHVRIATGAKGQFAGNVKVESAQANNAFIIKNESAKVPANELEFAINKSLEESGLKTRVSLSNQEGEIIMNVNNPGTFKKEISNHANASVLVGK